MEMLNLTMSGRKIDESLFHGLSVENAIRAAGLMGVTQRHAFCLKAHG